MVRQEQSALLVESFSGLAARVRRKDRTSGPGHEHPGLYETGRMAARAAAELALIKAKSTALAGYISQIVR